MKKILLIAALFAPTAFAQSSADKAAFDAFKATVSGGLHTITFGGGGVPIVTTPNTDMPTGSGWVRAGNMSISSGATPTYGYDVSGKAQLPLSGGAKVPVNVASRITPAALGRSVVACMGNIYCSGALLAGSAFASWMADNQLQYSPDTGFKGVPLDQKYIDHGCNSAYSSYLSKYPSFGTVAGGCNGQYGGVVIVVKGVYASNNSCSIHYSCSNGTYPNGKIGISGYNYNEPSRAVNLTLDQVRQYVEQNQPAPAVVYEVVTAGQPIQVEQPRVTGPSSVVSSPKVSTKTTTNPDGTTSTTVTTTTTTNNLTYSDNSVKNTVTTSSVVVKDGQAIETTETDEGEAKEEQKLETCGLPNKPACKIDEEGTPAKVEDTHKKDVDDALVDLKRLSQDPTTFWPTFPQIRWDFALPTGCAAIAIPAFSPWLQTIDVCQFQPIFHDIMSAVWVLGGLFGAISIFWRSTFAKAA
ncbi:hypothetical protein [Comamonas aquatica]|uniref:hypothetical protein n=1 Tax=Comamonas aquatica TaxID=225991 RepID=UPI003D00D2D2